MATEERDWDAIELDYRAGVLPIPAICKKHGVSLSQIKGHAFKYNWERKPLDPLGIKQAHGAATLAPSGPKFGMDSTLTPEDLEKQAVATAAAIIDIHRKDVSKLRDAAGKFSDTLANVFVALQNIETSPDMIESTMEKLKILVGDDAPVDLLEKLSRVMVRLVTIERQAYGLDVMPNPDPGADNGEAAKNEVSKLWEQVKQLQSEKTGQTTH